MATSADLTAAAVGMTNFGASPTSHDYDLLLSQFTHAGHALSPDGLGRSPPASQPTAADSIKMVDTPNGSSYSALQNKLFAQLGQDWTAPTDGLSQLDPATSNETSSVLQLAVAQMDSTAQQQLLSALLAQRAQNQIEQQQRPARSTSVGHSSDRSPRNARSHQNSPQAQMLQPQQQQQPPPVGFAHSSLPPSAMSSPVGSPYVHPSQNQQHFAQQLSLQQAALSQQMQQLAHNTAQVSQPNGAGSMAAFQPPPPANFQNAFAQQAAFNQAGQQSTEQHQLMMSLLAQAPVVPDMALRQTDTGASYATNQTDDDWVEDGYAFSPLLSPALTPFTQATSLPPSAPSDGQNVNLVSPAEFFSPLSSPAIMPQHYSTDHAWQQRAHRNSLSGLIDQTQALGFDPSQLSPLVQATSAGTYFPQQSPRLAASGSNGDAGQGTATGSGRRGASSKKTRPSPLLKPTPDGQLRRKKTMGANGPSAGSERRSSSLNSSGARSATTSPYMAPQPSHRVRAATGGPSSVNGSTGPGSAGSSAAKTSPPDEMSGSNNSPSPVDLSTAMSAQGSSSNEIMGPPPPRSSSHSRANSLHQQAMANSVPNATAEFDWIHQPVTPASFMSLGAIEGVEQLSSLSPQIGSFEQQDQHALDFHQQLHAMQMDPSLPLPPAVDSAASSHRSTPVPGPAKPKPSKKVAPAKVAPSSGPKLTSAPQAIAPAPAAIAPAPATAPSSASTSPTSLKGKSRAGSVSSAPSMRKVAPKPSPKMGPTGGSSKIKPLLPSGASPNSVNALSTKSVYQNVIEGRGVDLLGLDPSTVSALNAAPIAGGADTRRTSHKAAEQKRRDSLKQCFEQLRRILPPIDMSTIDESERLPGSGNVGGQRGGSIDPDNPNRGVSKVALLRRSNEYTGQLHDRISRRDMAITMLRLKLQELTRKAKAGEEVLDEDDDIPGLDLDNLDADEKAPGNMAFYENLDTDEDEEIAQRPQVAKRASGGGSRAKPPAQSKSAGSRRSSRGSAIVEHDEQAAMEVEEEM